MTAFHLFILHRKVEKENYQTLELPLGPYDRSVNVIINIYFIIIVVNEGLCGIIACKTRMFFSLKLIHKHFRPTMYTAIDSYKTSRDTALHMPFTQLQ
jgi:transposase